MFIKSIQMKDYKRFHDLTIDLGDSPKRIVALVGPNGCGKSSVFDAMIYEMVAYTGGFGGKGTKDYHYHSLHQLPSYNYQSISIMFDIGDFQSVYHKKEREGKQKTIFSFRSSFRYNGNLKISETKAVEDIIQNNYGASYASDIDQRIENNYRRLLGKYNKYMRDNDARPSDARKHIIGNLNASLSKCLDLEITDVGDVEGNRGTLYFKKSDSEIEFDYNVLSAGEKEAVDILLDLYLRKDEYTDSVYLFDEPELHLNTSIQRALLLEMNKMIPQNCQIWIATHSIGFLRAIQDELKNDSQIIMFNGENRWASERYTLTPANCSRLDWQNIFSTALDDLAKLICPKVIVYCEGRADPKQDGTERGLDADVYNTIFSKTYPEVFFVSSGGNTELDQRSNIAIIILSKIFTDLKILVLKDRDMASGNFIDENGREIYLSNNPQNHRVLKRFEIENYLYDKEVLSVYCQANNLEFDDNKYNIVVKDIVNDNLKDKTGDIKKCCGITFNINPETFKRNLAAYIDPSMTVYKELEEVIFEQK